MIQKENARSFNVIILPKRRWTELEGWWPTGKDICGWKCLIFTQSLDGITLISMVQSSSGNGNQFSSIFSFFYSSSWMSIASSLKWKFAFYWTQLKSIKKSFHDGQDLYNLNAFRNILDTDRGACKYYGRRLINHVGFKTVHLFKCTLFVHVAFSSL